MNGTTHAAVGAAAGAAAALFGHEPMLVAGLSSGLAAGGAMLADLDHSGSAASRELFGPLRGVIGPLVRLGSGGHRKVTHTAVAAVATGALWLGLMELLPRTHIASTAGHALAFSPATLAELVGVVLLVYLGLRTLTKISASRPRDAATTSRGWPILRRSRQRSITLVGVIAAVFVVLHYQLAPFSLVEFLVIGYGVGHLLADMFAGGVYPDWPLRGFRFTYTKRLVLGRVVTRYGRGDFYTGWICLLLVPVLLAAHEWALLGHSLL